MLSTHIMKYKPVGNIKKVWACKDKLILVEGAAGTGKTRGILEKLDGIANKHAGCRLFIGRQFRKSLTQTVLVTFNQAVKHPAVKFHSTLQEYQYPNGSVIVIGGLDKPQKLLSSQYDIIYLAEVNELSEEQVLTASTRLRNGVVPYQQLIMDINPTFAEFWANVLANQGKITRITTTHKDNPVYWDTEKNDYTELGHEYIVNTLGQLTGVLRLRYLKGLWASSEGLVYSAFEPSLHKLPEFDIPSTWHRLLAVDFGYSNPFICQWWVVVPNNFWLDLATGKRVNTTVTDKNNTTILIPENSLIMYREIYMSKVTISKHAEHIVGILEANNEYDIDIHGNKTYPLAICDHDAGDRAELEALGLITVAAYKAISIGIQGVIDRLETNNTWGRPSIYFIDDCVVEVDNDLQNKRLPFTTVQEFSNYEWAKSLKGLKEVPVDKNNHGADATRYLVAYVDELGIQKDKQAQHEFITVAEPLNYSNIMY